MKIAVLTMVKNEHVFLPIWLSHYTRHFGLENLFVIDNGSDDHCLDGLDIKNIFRVASDTFDDFVRAEFVSDIQNALIRYYDLVVFCDVDEILVVDPMLKVDLREYLNKISTPTVSPVGLNVIHNRSAGEKDLELSRPLFAQRKFVQFDAHYCKPIVTKSPVRWGAGFHELPGRPEFFDNNLFLFHLRAFDQNLTMSRFESIQKTRLSEEFKEKIGNSHFSFSPERCEAAFFGAVDGVRASDVAPFDFSSEVSALMYSNPSLSNRIKNIFGSRYNRRFVKKFKMPKTLHVVPDRFERAVELS
jgi:hypothetical protein